MTQESSRSRGQEEPQGKPSLWNFATDYYAQPGIAEVCLRLQDEHEFDVNLLLFCCWYGVHYGIAEKPLLQALYEYSCDWQQNVVRPMRETRRWLKSAIASSPGNKHELTMLRERVKTLELESERQQLEMLASMARAIQPDSSQLTRKERCSENLGALQNLMAKGEEEAVTGLLRELLAGLPD